MYLQECSKLGAELSGAIQTINLASTDLESIAHILQKINERIDCAVNLIH
jgi:hypothetical protein